MSSHLMKRVHDMKATLILWSHITFSKLPYQAIDISGRYSKNICFFKLTSSVSLRLIIKSLSSRICRLQIFNTASELCEKTEVSGVNNYYEQKLTGIISYCQ
jgi:hypothetical protein